MSLGLGCGFSLTFWIGPRHRFLPLAGQLVPIPRNTNEPVSQHFLLTNILLTSYSV